MDTKRICTLCGKALAANAPEGLCPECLLKAGIGSGVDIGTETGSGASRPGFVLPSVDELAPLFPELEILELIGKGGMGAVYKARQKQLNRLVALKVLPPDVGHEPAFAARFTHEAQALALLNHAGIVTLYEFGSVAATPPPQECVGGAPAAKLYYFLMEFVDGVNLRQLMHTGRVSAREALAIVPQICDALQFAHDQGIVHRDIKPENILLDRRGRVKVADFGLAKIVGGNEPLTPSLSPSDGERVAKPGDGSPVLTDAGKVVGTPHYMSPEQIEAPGEVDHRADIYALGVVFYQMLTGELPGKKIEPPSKKVHLDVRLDEVVLRALEKKPELRYQQASLLKTQVETIATEMESAGSATGESSDEQRKSQMVRLVEMLLGITFTAPVAINMVNLSALGFLGFLRFLGYVPLPGMHYCFGLSGFFGLFGLIGFAYMVEAYKRRNKTDPSPSGGSRGEIQTGSAIKRPAARVKRLTPLAWFISSLAVMAFLPGSLVERVAFGVSFCAVGLLVIRWLEVRKGNPRQASRSDTRDAHSPRSSAPMNQEARFSLTVVVGAVSVTGFYAALVAVLAVVSVLPFGEGVSLGLVAVLLMGLPLFLVVASGWLKRSPSATRSGWLQAFAWIAWLLAIPVISFGVFFLIALLTSSGPWNPAPDEAVIVPLTWLGSLLLPICGWVLWRAATPGSSRDEGVHTEEITNNAGGSRNSAFAACSAAVLLLLVASGNAWAMLIGSALLLVVGLAWFARGQWRLALLVALAALGVATAIVLTNFIPRGGGSLDPAQLAESPIELRKLPTDRVIQAALTKPDLPWAWNELEKRPLTAEEAGRIIDGLTAWVQREHPSGPSTPIGGFEQRILERLDARQLIGLDQKIRFVVALHGDLRLEPLGRVREGDHRLEVFGESRYIWRHDLLGLVMMNASFSASVNGRPAEFESDFDDHWNVQHFGNVLTLPELAPGRHKLKLEVLSALAAKEDLVGLSSSAPPAEWPPAKKRWTRSTELEFMVYPRDAVIVAQTDDPALDPLSNGSLGIKPVLIRSKGDRAQAVVAFDVADNLPVPISFDVTLLAGDQTIACGTLWAVRAPGGGSSSGEELTVELDRLDPVIRAADVVLTPNPTPVEQRASVDRIWGREIVFHQVRLIRQDLGEAATSVVPTAAREPSSTVPVQVSAPPQKRVVLLLPFALLGGLILLLFGTAFVVGWVLLLRRKRSGGAGKVVAIGCASLAVLGILLLVLLGVGGLFWSRASRMEAARPIEAVQHDRVEAQVSSFGPQHDVVLQTAGNTPSGHPVLLDLNWGLA